MVAQTEEAPETTAHSAREARTAVEAHRVAHAGVSGVVIGALIGLKTESQTALVIYPGQPGSAAIAAASVEDLHGEHVGRQVLIAFENCDPRRPIIVGLLRGQRAWPLPERPGQLEVDADGERLVLTAKEQLVLRCGKASITLTKSGKVLIEGEFVSSRATGLNRIKGGSIQLN